MKRFWAQLAVWCGKHAGIVAVIGLLLTLTFGVGTTRLKFATSQSSYLNKSDKIFQDDLRYEKLFGGQAMVVMFTMTNGKKVDQFFSPANRKKLASLVAELNRGAKANHLRNTIDPEMVLRFSNDLTKDDWVPPKDGKPGHAVAVGLTESVAGKALLRAANADPTKAGRAARLKDSVATLTKSAAVKGPHDMSNPAWIKFLLYNNSGQIRKALLTFFPNTTHAELIVRLDGNQPLDEQSASADFVTKTAAKYTFENATTLTTGAPSLLQSINNYLRGGMLLLGGIAALVMIVILLVLFDVRWRLLPLGVIAVGLIWAFGTAGFLGIPLTLATIAGLPVMLGVGIDYAIQMHARIEEEAVLENSPHPIQEAARNLGPALLVVTFDAVFAFSALHFAKVPMIRQFGYLLAVGIAVICFASILIPLAILGIREFKSPTTRHPSKRSIALGNTVVKMGSLPKSVGLPLIAVSLLIFFGGIIVEPKLQLQTDPVQWVNQKSQVVRNINALERGTGSANELGVSVADRSGVFTQPDVSYIDKMTVSALRTYPRQLATANSVISNISDLINDVPGSARVTPLASEVQAAFELAPTDIQKTFATPDGTSLNVVFRTGNPQGESVPLEQQATIVAAMNKQFAAATVPETLSLTPSGLAVVGVGLLQNLEANRVLLTYLSILFVALFLAVRLRSVIRSLLSLIPVLIAVGLSSLAAYVFKLKLSPLTAVGGPLIVAICTEFTSLILLRYVEERGRGLSPREAIDHTASRTGRAFIVSGLTAVSGVAVIAASSMPLLRDFGIIVGMNVLVALISALVFLPPMLVWADSDGRNWVARHLVPSGVLDGTEEPVKEPFIDVARGR